MQRTGRILFGTSVNFRHKFSQQVIIIEKWNSNYMQFPCSNKRTDYPKHFNIFIFHAMQKYFAFIFYCYALQFFFRPIHAVNSKINLNVCISLPCPRKQKSALQHTNKNCKMQTKILFKTIAKLIQYFWHRNSPFWDHFSFWVTQTKSFSAKIFGVRGKFIFFFEATPLYWVKNIATYSGYG